MKNSLFGLILVGVMGLSTIGCGIAYADDAAFPSGQSTYGCVVVADEFGERTVCSNYYLVNGGYAYWDGFYGAWIFPGGRYWYGGRFYAGYPRGWQGHYAGSYHPHGWHASHNGGTGHAGGHGGYHNGGGHGGGHGGGGHGGHGGHR